MWVCSRVVCHGHLHRRLIEEFKDPFIFHRDRTRTPGPCDRWPVIHWTGSGTNGLTPALLTITSPLLSHTKVTGQEGQVSPEMVRSVKLWWHRLIWWRSLHHHSCTQSCFSKPWSQTEGSASPNWWTTGLILFRFSSHVVSSVSIGPNKQYKMVIIRSQIIALINKR